VQEVKLTIWLRRERLGYVLMLQLVQVVQVCNATSFAAECW
jgi:hypothetical protein